MKTGQRIRNDVFFHGLDRMGLVYGNHTAKVELSLHLYAQVIRVRRNCYSAPVVDKSYLLRKQILSLEKKDSR